MKNELKIGIYSNGTEKFEIVSIIDKYELKFHALTDIEYLPIKQGERTILPIRFIQSLIDDEEMGYRYSTDQSC